MTNPKILLRIKALYAAGQIDDAKIDAYVTKGIIAAKEAEEIKGEGN
ncbi:MAG: hypothetical protein GX683_00200 [Ruminococcaceae bacterium]|nr:hypothetical protein [Oscillospiraceae bacterium]